MIDMLTIILYLKPKLIREDLRFQAYQLIYEYENC